MNSFRHIFIAFLCLLAASSVAQAQNDWDSVLDRYEKIALQCMSLRDKAAAGERVSQKSVTELLGELNRLRNSLQQASGKMTAKQRDRFRSVRELYDGKMDGQDGHDEKSQAGDEGALRLRSGTVEKKTAEASSHQPVGEHNHIPVGERSRTTVNSMVEPLPKVEGWSAIMKDIPKAKVDVLDPQARPTRSIRTTETTGTMTGKHLTFSAIPTLSIGDTRQGGIFLSLSRGRLGGYLSARTNFVSQLYAYECLSDGATAGPEAFKGNGGQRIGEYSLSAGAVFKALSFRQSGLPGHGELSPYEFGMDFFAGAGFGSSTLCWSDFRGTWARVKDYSASGLQVEGGMVFHFRNLSLLGGVSWLTARPSSGPFMPVFTLGAGVSF